MRGSRNTQTGKSATTTPSTTQLVTRALRGRYVDWSFMRSCERRAKHSSGSVQQHQRGKETPRSYVASIADGLLARHAVLLVGQRKSAW